VEGLRIIDASGRVWDSREDPDVVKFGRVALGVLGIVSTVTIRAVPMFKMKKTVLDVPLDELLANHDAWVARYERFQWSFVPYTNTASVILREEVPFDTPVDDCWVSPTPTVCTDVSYKTLVDSLPAYENRTLYTEMEMFVPVEHAVAAVTDFIEYQSQVKPKHDDSK
jgi:L-gulonolactone oxidase